jgi:hypothetical protein
VCEHGIYISYISLTAGYMPDLIPYLIIFLFLVSLFVLHDCSRFFFSLKNNSKYSPA